MVKGIEKLTEEQKELIYIVNELHIKIIGTDYKAGMEIIETWIGENNIVCVRLKKGEREIGIKIIFLRA